MKRILQAAVLLLVAGAGALAPARAALVDYPISGRWASASGGGVPDCERPPFMAFVGYRRFDFGNSSIPEYVALSVVRVDGATAFRIVERVFNGMVEGEMTYTLFLADADHAIMELQATGRRIALLRCT